METALAELWRYTGELFVAADYETVAGYDVSLLKDDWMKKITANCTAIKTNSTAAPKTKTWFYFMNIFMEIQQEVLAHHIKPVGQVC